MIKLAIPVVLLIAVAFVIAVVLSTFHVTWWLGFLVGILGQILIYNAFTSILDVYVTLKNKQLENERIAEFSYQGMEVECPCSKKRKDFVPIRLNDVNLYKCGDCEKTVSVYVSAETALQTEPIISTDTTTALAPLLANINNGSTNP
jgi:ABC-type transport system involved in multi-copper enzyme maturation permease subunit